EVIYSLRDKVLAREDILGQLKTMLHEAVEFVVYDSCPENESPDSWDLQRIERTMNAMLLEQVSIPPTVERVADIMKLYEEPIDNLLAFIDSFAEHEQILQFIPQVMLSHIDTTWVKHLEVMTRLKEGIG